MPRTRQAAAAAIAGAFLPFEEKSAAMSAEAFEMVATIRTAIAAAKLAPSAGVATMAILEEAAAHYGKGDRLVLRAHDELSKLAKVAGVELAFGDCDGDSLIMPALFGTDAGPAPVA